VNALLNRNAYQTPMQIESKVPVVAERPMYFSYSGMGGWGWTGGHCMAGATHLAKEYFFAVGTPKRAHAG